MPSSLDQLIDHYIRASGVYVAEMDDVGLVGLTHDVAARDDVLIKAIWWCTSEERAKALVTACRSTAGSAQQTAGLIPAVARVAGVGIATPAEVDAQAPPRSKRSRSRWRR